MFVHVCVCVWVFARVLWMTSPLWRKFLQCSPRYRISFYKYNFSFCSIGIVIKFTDYCKLDMLLNDNWSIVINFFSIRFSQTLNYFLMFIVSLATSRLLCHWIVTLRSLFTICRFCRWIWPHFIRFPCYFFSFVSVDGWSYIFLLYMINLLLFDCFPCLQCTQ